METYNYKYKLRSWGVLGVPTPQDTLGMLHCIVYVKRILFLHMYIGWIHSCYPIWGITKFPSSLGKSCCAVVSCCVFSCNQESINDNGAGLGSLSTRASHIRTRTSHTRIRALHRVPLQQSWRWPGMIWMHLLECRSAILSCFLALVWASWTTKGLKILPKESTAIRVLPREATVIKTLPKEGTAKREHCNHLQMSA